ncbi:MAG: redoxin domain-containing protein [Planctomycetes bacterium]|nr:redoxin domain-containing protein [Planctomycetota bacterium]
MSDSGDILLGKLAVQTGLVTASQLARLLREQESGVAKPLGQLLLERGFVTQEQLEELLRRQAANLAAPSSDSPLRRQESLLGAEAVRRGWLTQEQVHAAIRQQGLDEAAGRPRRLGEILVERKLLTQAQVVDLLARQGKALYACPRCGARYNVPGGPEPGTVLCPKCKVPLARANDASRVDASGTVVLRPGAPAPSAEAARPASVSGPSRPSPAHAAAVAHPPMAPQGLERPSRVWAAGGGLVLVVLLGIGFTLWHGKALEDRERAAREAAEAALATQYGALERSAGAVGSDLPSFLAACDSFAQRVGDSPFAARARSLATRTRRAEVRRRVAAVEVDLLSLLRDRRFADARTRLGEFPADLDIEGDLGADRERMTARIEDEGLEALQELRAQALGLCRARKFDEAGALFESARSWGVAKVDAALPQLLEEVAAERTRAQASARETAATEACDRILREVAALESGGRLEAALSKCDALPAEFADSPQAARLRKRRDELQVRLARRPAAVPPREAPPPGVTPIVGQFAPDFKVKGLMNRTLSLRENRGRVVLLQFWSMHNAETVAGLPAFVQAAQPLLDRGLVLLGVNLDAEREPVLQLLMKQRMKWPQYQEPKGVTNELAVQFGIRQTPMTFLLDAEGVVRQVDPDGLALLGKAEELLGQAPALPVTEGSPAARAPSVPVPAQVAGSLPRCSECGGKGIVTSACTGCNGGGRVACPLCGGSPISPCYYCDGKGVLRRGGIGAKTRRCLICDATGGVRCPWGEGKTQALDPVCDGSGRVTRPCPACQGAGYSRSTNPAPTASCSLCNGRGVRECLPCRGKKTVTTDCVACLGGATPCTKCSGKWRVPCRGCRGDGKSDTVTTAGEAVEARVCSICKGLGYSSCDQCKKGKTDCTLCAGKGARVESCPSCRGAGELPCPGCR